MAKTFNLIAPGYYKNVDLSKVYNNVTGEVEEIPPTLYATNIDGAHIHRASVCDIVWQGVIKIVEEHNNATIKQRKTFLFGKICFGLTVHAILMGEDNTEQAITKGYNTAKELCKIE